MRSLRARLLITIGAAVLVATVLTVVVAAVLVRGRVQDQALSNLERQADAVAAVVRVSDATRALASGRGDVRVPVEGEDELAELSAAFNAMASELAGAREAERRFLLSVSHELKTPLTAIRGYAEGLADGAVAPAEAG